MIRTRRSPYKRMITDINITPFTDVCLVLLIIFMVTATALTRESSLHLNLPKAATTKTPLPDSVTVRITRDMKLYLSSQVVTFAELGPKLQKIHATTGTRLLVVKADEGIPYKMVISTIDIARQSGLDQIALATRQPDAE